MSKENTKTAVLVIGIFAVITIVLVLLIPMEKDRLLHEEHGKLAVLAETDERAQYVIDNIESYPQRLLDMYYSDDMYFDFMYNYPFHCNDYMMMKYTDEELNSELPPRLYMYDNRWAYEKIGGGFIRTDGCVAVTLTMAYIGLYHDDAVDPKIVADIAGENGLIAQWGGVSETNIETMFDALGMKYETNFYDIRNGAEPCSDPSIIKNTIDNGGYVMLGTFGEKFGGHALLVVDYTDEGFIINDPASEEYSNKVWTFEELAPELCYIWSLYTM